jgi:hypothetical protein
MGRVGKKVPPEKMAIAEANGISRSTLYARLNKGWEIEKAISESPLSRPQLDKLERNSDGELVTIGEKRGKSRTIRFPESKDDLLDEAIANSGMNQVDFIVNATLEYINSKNKKPSNRKKK